MSKRLKRLEKITKRLQPIFDSWADKKISNMELRFQISSIMEEYEDYYRFGISAYKDSNIEYSLIVFGEAAHDNVLHGWASMRKLNANRKKPDSNSTASRSSQRSLNLPKKRT